MITCHDYTFSESPRPPSILRTVSDIDGEKGNKTLSTVKGPAVTNPQRRLHGNGNTSIQSVTAVALRPEMTAVRYSGLCLINSKGNFLFIHSLNHSWTTS